MPVFLLANPLCSHLSLTTPSSSTKSQSIQMPLNRHKMSSSSISIIAFLLISMSINPIRHYLPHPHRLILELSINPIHPLDIHLAPS